MFSEYTVSLLPGTVTFWKKKKKKMGKVNYIVIKYNIYR